MRNFIGSTLIISFVVGFIAWCLSGNGLIGLGGFAVSVVGMVFMAVRGEMMNVLAACESSGTVRDAFIALGHNAMSCDLLPSEKPGPHYQGDIFDVLYDDWDLVIAFPPCTDLAVSGAKHFWYKRADGRQQKSIDFFMAFTKLNAKWSLENPVGIMSTIYRKPDQIIQPWQFGHPESKKTCLWLNGLPPLVSTNILKLPERGYWDNQTSSGQNKLPPSADRAKIRSKTYQGIAQAMAEQWGNSENYPVDLFATKAEALQ
jgi:hypothetical protein